MSPSAKASSGVGVERDPRVLLELAVELARAPSRRSRRTRARGRSRRSAPRRRSAPARPSISARASTAVGWTGPPAWTSASSPATSARSGTASADGGLGRAVEHQPHRALVVVLEHEHDGAPEVVLQLRRGDQDLSAQRPFHTGSRFSAKAVAPSRASSEPNTGPEISPCFCHFSSSLQPGSSIRIRLEAISASGPFLAIASASSSAASSARARLGQAVHQAELRAALGGDRVAGERQLHRHVVGDAARQAQQRAARGHQAALGLRDAELCALGGDDQVARQRHLEAAGHGEALDRGDDRLVGGLLGDPGEAAPLDVRALARHERLQVHARRRSPCPRR